MAISNCFSISNYNQLEKVIQFRKKYKKKSIIFINYYLIKGLGIDWLKELILLINKKHKNHTTKFFVDSGYDYGLCTLLIREKVHFVKLKSNHDILKKIHQIANKNKVLLNPKFNIVDLSKIKNTNYLEKRLMKKHED